MKYTQNYTIQVAGCMKSTINKLNWI